MAPDGARHPGTVGAAAMVYVADLDRPTPDAADAHHLGHVLRLRPGEPVVAGDGLGRWRLTRYRGTARRPAPDGEPLLEADGPLTVVPRPTPPVTIGFVPVKGDKPEWVVQKLTEAGVDRIAVLRSARAVVRWEGDRAARSIERLRRVAREAGAQSRSPWLPEVVGVLDLAGLAGVVAPAPLALAHPGGDPPSVAMPAMAVGPEGGWDDSELTPGGFPVVGLGPGILRAETAAVASGLLLCAIRNGLVGEVRRPPSGPRGDP
ncbi:MAG TPA: 16S rRNA (uracil(1498)-N(3))-methyltransferase [Acidimicrobiales bacterium]|nr:16S rRNA (uracil(1498)-N(3))-methyltransferase [Acidimicrobiales bacterium]